MSDDNQNAEEEPSIEEILDSIRQIITDDDEDDAVDAPAEEIIEAEAVEETPAEPEAAEETPAEPQPLEEEEDILDLTEIVEDTAAEDEAPIEDTPEPSEPEQDIDMSEEPEASTESIEDIMNEEAAPEETPAEETPVEEAPEEDIDLDFADTASDDDILDAVIAGGTEQVTANAFAELAQKAAIDKTGTVTIEDIVRAEIRPILRTWVDDNLPKMMERLLQEELEKIAKRSMES